MADNSGRDDETPTGSTRVTRRIKAPVLSVVGERSPSGARRRLAAGTDMKQLEPMDSYRVVIHYREPSYESRHGRKDEPYRWTFQVRARSDDDAVDFAVAEFEEIERKSSVSWTREIVGVFVERESNEPSAS